jgi:hypothetical protein
MASPSKRRARASRFAGLCAPGLAVLLLACAPSGADAAASNPANQARLDSTVRFLQDAQNADGGFGLNARSESDQDVSAWVTFALAAAGINPQDQAQPDGIDAYGYLTAHAEQALRKELCAPVICTTSLEREALVADTAGTSPRDFGGIDLVGELLGRKLPDGSFPFVPGGRGEVNDTIFAILSLSPLEEPSAHTAVELAASWLLEAQNPDGSWPTLHPKTEGEVDMTGAAVEALNAAGLHDTDAQRKAFDYLHRAQTADGGFPEFPGRGESNVASTAWAVQGIGSAGENPETWVASSGAEPLSYMASLQQPDGHIRYEASREENGLWMTAMVAPTFAAQSLPPPRVPRATPHGPTVPATSVTSTPAPGSGESGQGGESAGAGGGVIAGGGGSGAPLFSRPQPQSRGATPGGARQLRGASAKRTAERRNPGPPRRTPVQTVEGSTTARAAGHGNGVAGASSAGSGASGPGHGAGAGGRSLAARSGDGHSSAGREVHGVAIGDASSKSAALEAGAPGLHGAGAGGNETPWPAIAIAAAAGLLALAGSQLERRRPQAVV